MIMALISSILNFSQQIEHEPGLVMSFVGSAVWWRRRLAGGFTGDRDAKNRRPFLRQGKRDAGATDRLPQITNARDCNCFKRLYFGIRGTTRCNSLSEAPSADWTVALSDGARYTPDPLDTS